MNLPLYFISDIHLMGESSENYPEISKNLEKFFWTIQSLLNTKISNVSTKSE